VIRTALADTKFLQAFVPTPARDFGVTYSAAIFQEEEPVQKMGNRQKRRSVSRGLPVTAAYRCLLRTQR
jgi:hypothetical protein